MILTERFYLLIGLREEGSDLLAVSTCQHELLELAACGRLAELSEFDGFCIRSSDPHPLLAPELAVTHPGSPTTN